MNFSIWLRMNVIFTIESGNIYHNLIRDVIIVILLVSFIPFFIVVSKKLFEFSIEPGKSFVTLGESSVKSLKLINQKLKFCFYSWGRFISYKGLETTHCAQYLENGFDDGFFIVMDLMMLMICQWWLLCKRVSISKQ